MLEAIKIYVLNMRTAQVHSADTLEVTGPGIWSDAIHAYLLSSHGAQYGTDPLRKNLVKRQATLIGSVLILPIHGFGDGSANVRVNEQEYVTQVLIKHQFQGSWKS